MGFRIQFKSQQLSWRLSNKLQYHNQLKGTNFAVLMTSTKATGHIAGYTGGIASAFLTKVDI